MTALVRLGTVVGLPVVLAVACNSAGQPTAPSSNPTPLPSSGQPPPTGEIPPLAGPLTTYRFSAPLSYPVRDFTMMSAYLLYDSGAFALQYSGRVTAQYVGSYTHDHGRVDFDFSPPDGRSDAVGTLNGDSLEVQYSDMMQHSDFENAVYGRSP